MAGRKNTVVFCVAIFSLLLSSVLPGASKRKKDISKARGLRLTDKIPRLQFVLPRKPKKTRDPVLAGMPAWRFAEPETQRDRDLVFWKDNLKRCQSYLAAAKKYNLTEDQKKKLQINVAIARRQIREIETYYKSVRLVIEDPDDPDTCLVVKTSPVNRKYTIEAAVAERQGVPPVWLRYRVARAHDVLLQTPTVRFKRWQGFRLHLVWTDAFTPKGQKPRRYHDMVYLYRHVYTRAGPYLVEVSCRWNESPKRSKDFARAFEYLMRGFALLDRR